MMELIIGLRFTVITCCQKGCGLTFAVPDTWHSKRQEDHSGFYCPNGHNQHFAQKTEAEILSDELARKTRVTEQLEAQLQSERDRRETVERSLISTKGVVTRTKNRIANGVCPCCKRTFVNVARHMKDKHPKYAVTE